MNTLIQGGTQKKMSYANSLTKDHASMALQGMVAAFPIQKCAEGLQNLAQDSHEGVISEKDANITTQLCAFTHCEKENAKISAAVSDMSWEQKDLHLRTTVRTMCKRQNPNHKPSNKRKPVNSQKQKLLTMKMIHQQTRKRHPILF